jgi:hypothetical protein
VEWRALDGYGAGRRRFDSLANPASIGDEACVGGLMQLKLSDLEIEILRELVNGEAVSISSQQRVCLELAGMIREGAKGIVVTLTGRRLASEKSSEAAASDAALGVKVSRDSRSRRTPLRRRSIF